MKPPSAADDQRAEQRGDGLRHGRGDVHDAEVLAAVSRVGQHLGGERLVDREEAAVAEAEQAGRDHGDGEVGHEGEQQRGDAPAAPTATNTNELAPAELVGEPAEHERRRG